MSLINKTGFKLTNDEVSKILYLGVEKIGLPSDNTKVYFKIINFCGCMYSIEYRNEKTKVNTSHLLTEVEFLNLIDG